MVTLKTMRLKRYRMKKPLAPPSAVRRGATPIPDHPPTITAGMLKATGDNTAEPKVKTDAGTENFQTQHLLLICRDQSGTAGQFRERYLAGEREFCAESRSDRMTAFSVRIAQVQFGGGRVEKSPFCQASDWHPAELIGWGGDTPLGRGLDVGVDHILAEAARLRQVGVPVGKLLFINETDGDATDGECWDRALPKVHKAEREERLLVFPVGVGNVVPAINRISCKRPAAVLNDENIEGFYKWLADVLGRVSRSRPGQDVELPAADGWARIKG